MTPIPQPARLSLRRGLLSALSALVLAAAALHAPAAQARGHGGGHWHGGAFFGGLVIGAAIARPYYYPYYQPYYAPPAYYYPPAAYYPPPPVVYTTPPAPVTYIERQPNYVTAPSAATPQLPLEQRLQRLKAMCDKGLFTQQECTSRRAEILREM